MKTLDMGKYFWEKFTSMKHLLILLSVIIVACSMSACNTIKGAGQDVSAVGRDVSAGARGVANAM